MAPIYERPGRVGADSEWQPSSTLLQPGPSVLYQMQTFCWHERLPRGGHLFKTPGEPLRGVRPSGSSIAAALDKAGL